MQKLQFIINLMYAIQKKKSIKLNPIKSFIIKLAEFLLCNLFCKYFDCCRNTITFNFILNSPEIFHQDLLNLAVLAVIMNYI